MPLLALPTAGLRRLRSLFTSADPTVRMLVAFGVFLAATGAFHVAVWLLAGAPSLAGPVSWRKPIVFGFSSATATLSVAWLVSLLPVTKRRNRAAWTYAVPMVLEVGLIDLQRWRGVASHFNNTSALDTGIYNLMAVLIIVCVSAIGVLGLRLFRSVEVARDTRLAGALGVAYLLLGSVMGAAISAHASVVVATGVGTTSMVGAAPLKLPHGFALHALQVLPILAWLLSRTSLSVAVRARLVVRAAISYGVLFGAALVQTLLGRAPDDPAPVAVALAAVGLLLLVPPVLDLFELRASVRASVQASKAA